MNWVNQLASKVCVAPPAPSVCPPDAPFLRVAGFWIWFSALAGLAGWTLSALGQLNRAGYVIFFSIAAAGCLAVGRRYPRGVAGRCLPDRWRRLRGWMRRFRRPLPVAYAALAALVLLGGVIYPPTNYTGLNYHLGRVLQWIAHGHWWWIHTPVARMNFSGCAFEWLTTPVVLFTRSDRALFLVNFLPFLLLPGLLFSVFTRLGVRARVAWHWMWLLPTGYTFLLQGGSIGNDAFAAFYALAAVDFGCRAWVSRRVRDLWLSLLAAALLTGTKPTSLPLLLPWIILALSLLPLLRRHWGSTLAVAGLAGMASYIPIALANFLHCGDWLGRSSEPASVHLEVHQPLIGIAGNAFQLALNNWLPPVFPPAGWWNRHAPGWLAHSIFAGAYNNFDPGFLFVGEVPTEDTTGIGFGLSFLLAVSILAAWWLRRGAGQTSAATPLPPWLCRAVMIAAWVALLAYAAKSGMATAARLISPYYLLLVPLLLMGRGQSPLTRRRWWRMLALGVLALALVVLVLSPDRPLWPAQTLLTKVLERHPNLGAVRRALDVYSVYSRRNDALAGVRTLLPPGLDAVGFIGDGDDCDISLWRPFGSRRVDHFLVTDPPAYVWSRVGYVVVGGCILQERNVRLEDWLRQNHAEVIGVTNVLEKLGEGSQPWYLTRLQP